MYEQEKWMLDIHEQMTHMHATLALLLTELANQKVIDLDKFYKKKQTILGLSQYKTILDDLEEQRADLEKLVNEDLGDFFSGCFSGELKI